MTDITEKTEQYVIEKNPLPQKIRQGLNELRKSELPFHEKAEQLSSLLAKSGCQDIAVMDCDVCVDDFDPDYGRKFSETYPDNFSSLSPDEQKEIQDRMDRLIPREAKVRVQAETPAGYFTWCFNCECTMCCNEVDYPEDPNWDQLHKEKAHGIILHHPEWSVSKFALNGSTRNRVAIDVIANDPNFKYHAFDEGGFHISVNPFSEHVLKANPKILDCLEDVQANT